MPWFPDFAGSPTTWKHPSEAPETLASDRVVHQGLARAFHGRDWSSRTRPLMIEANPTAWTQSTGTGRNTTS
jgi:hypothetical protein